MIRSIPGDLPLDDLNLDNLSSYLLSTGWKRAMSKDNRMIVFTRDEEDGDSPSLVTVPAREQSSDFRGYMAMAIVRIADVEETTPQNIAEKILSVGQDIISLRLLLPSHERPSLEIASSMFCGLRNLIIYGACMEKDKRRHFDHPFRVGREQAQHFQLAHTFRGSFGFTIESNMADTSQHTLQDSYSSLPLQRKVLERITRGLLFTKSAQQKQNPEEISQNFEQGFNANMCKAVVDMLQEMQDTQVVYSVSWSRHLPPSQDVAQVTPILLDRETSHYLQEAAQYLEQTADKDLEDDRTLEGLIISLSSEKPNERIVTISSEEWGKISFSAQPDEYTAACNAHQEGRVISVRGKLTKPGKRRPWILLSPHDFHFE